MNETNNQNTKDPKRLNIKFIGTINIGTVKREIPPEEYARKEFAKKYNLEIDSKKYSIVFVPTRLIGNATYALFQLYD